MSTNNKTISLSKADALAFARACGNRHGWIALCKRDDISPKEAIIFTKESKYWILWFDLLRRTDVQDYLQKLPLEAAIDFCKEIGSYHLWKIILRRNDISAEKAITLTKEIPPSYDEGKIVTDWRMSDPSIWEAVLGRIDVPLQEALTYAKEFNKLNNSELWAGIISRQDISFEVALVYANEYLITEKSSYATVFSRIFRRADAPIEELAKLARQFNNQALWIELVKRKDVNTEQAVKFATESKDSTVMGFALNSYDNSHLFDENGKRK